MNKSTRIFLLTAALSFASTLALISMALESAFEPESVAVWSPLYWIGAGLMLSAPFSIPALVPHRWPRVFILCSFLGATLLALLSLICAYMLLTIMWHRLTHETPLPGVPVEVWLAILIGLPCGIGAYLLGRAALTALPRD
jgi:hypothetical protein